LPALWPFALYFLFVLILTGGMLGVSYVLGERHKGRSTDQQYESGIPATGSAHIRFDVKFYLNAMFFVVFDLESMFVITWAISLREAGWPGYFEMLIFIGVLAVALVYLWRLGALDWSTRRERREREVAEAQSRALRRGTTPAMTQSTNPGDGK
jgi:NADH-quinone oxidoreductase subunit A